GRWIDDLIQAAREIDMDAMREIATALEELAPHLEYLALEEGYFEEEPPEDGGDSPESGAVGNELTEVDGPFGLCEERFYRVQSRFVKDVEQWLEQQAKDWT